MRIPLDYYRILGLPTQASAEQLQQAYHDRILQLPRREYSEAAIAARKRLLEEAYAVLSAPSQRTRYDASYFAYTHDLAVEHAVATAEERYDNKRTQSSARLLPSELIPVAVDSYTPSIEISDELFVGALLILQELGEYELVLNLGLPYLSSSSAFSDNGQKSESELVRSDIVLTVALACLELGREQWQQGQYENAATSLETGQELLLREELFVRVRGEIQADIYKLRPYCILELLARPEDNVAQRRRLGLKLLQDMLQQRGGIDGTGDDGSGLSIDDFLRFIQQLRSYLTVAEQQSLFEAESKRPSAVASYLTVYALIARGFSQRMPVLIRQAKLLLMRLGKRQDLHLEQAVCSLLLGQTAEASHDLELSQEYEPLAFIREHSQGSPDLLPGLCLYSESWLQTEVFQHFRDLTQQQASLKDYFADPQVQAYLEALPTQVEATNELAAVAPQALSYDQATSTHQSRDSALVSQSSSTNVREQRVPDTAQSVQASVEAQDHVPLANPANVAIVHATKRMVGSTAKERSRRRTRSKVARGFGFLKTGKERFLGQGSISTLALKNVLEAKKTRLLLLAVAGVLGIGVLGFLVSQTSARLRHSVPAPSLQAEQPLVQLDQPPLPIPDPSSQLLATEQPLTQETAEQVIQDWLSTKMAAFGSNHAVDRLERILVGQALSQWQRLAQIDKATNRYRQYKHSLKVDSVQTSESALNKAQVEASVNEVAQVYENGKLNRHSSYDENLRVRYDLVRQDGQWRIREMTVL